MKHTALVSKPLLARTDLEILRRFRSGLAVQSEFDTTERLGVGGDVEVDRVGDCGCGGAGGEEIGEEVHAEGRRR